MPVNFKYASAQLLRTLRNREIIHPQYISCAFDALFQDYIAWLNFDAAIRSLCTCSATHMFPLNVRHKGRVDKTKLYRFIMCAQFTFHARSVPPHTPSFFDDGRYVSMRA